MDRWMYCLPAILNKLAGGVLRGNILTPVKHIVELEPFTLAIVYTNRSRYRRIVGYSADPRHLEELAKKEGCIDVILVGVTRCPEGYVPFRGSKTACFRRLG